MSESRIPLWESGFHAFLASRLLNAGGKEPAQKTGFFPALEGRDFQLVGATISRLPAMRKELKALARRMAELEALIRSAEE